MSTFNWAPSSSDSRYQSGTDEGGSGNENLYLAKDLDNDTVLLQYRGSDGVWEITDVESQNVDVEGQINGRYVAAPGDVQSALDAAASDGDGAVVVLHPDETYTFESPIDVYENVELHCNGAFIDQQSDNDVFTVHGGGSIYNPFVDVSGIAFTSAVFRFDTEISNTVYRAHQRTKVSGGKTFGDFGQGTLFKFYQNNASTGRLTFVECDHRGTGIGTVVDIESAHSDGWINSNTIRGNYGTYEYGIVQSGPGNASSNTYRMDLQPVDGNVGTTVTTWDLDAGHNNLFDGRLWDAQNHSSDAWVIGANAGEHNALLSWNWFSDSRVSDNKGDQSNALIQPRHIFSGPNNNLALGELADASGQSATALGRNASASVGRTVSVGEDSSAGGDRSTAVGHNAQVTSSSAMATAVGQGSYANANYTTAVGRNSTADGTENTSFGYDSSATGARTSAFGGSAIANADNSIAFGQGAEVLEGNSLSAAIGKSASVSGQYGVGIGESAAVGDSHGTAVGYTASVTTRGTAVGSQAQANSYKSLALGQGVVVDVARGAVIGGDQAAFGAISGTFSDTDLSNGQMVVDADETNERFDIRYKDTNGAVQTGTVKWGEATGSETATGDGSVTTFTISHGLSATPTHADVTPKTEAASTDHWVSVDSTNITINYAAAPGDGENLEWFWSAEV